MRIVRLANFVAPHSGGLRTCLRELGAGYLAAGHEPVLVIPGERDSDEQTAQGRVITLRGPRIPFTGGYRVLLRQRRVAALLGELRPDTLEVSDRTTLRWTGRWAREHGVPAVMISHESLTALISMALPGLDLPVLTRFGRRPGPGRRGQPPHRARLPPGDLHDRAGRPRIRADRRGEPGHAPLGVDLDTFSPPGRRPGPPARRRASRCWCTAAGCPRKRSRSAR